VFWGVEKSKMHPLSLKQKTKKTTKTVHRIRKRKERLKKKGPRGLHHPYMAGMGVAETTPKG
jgi:hypothetical protein